MADVHGRIVTAGHCLGAALAAFAGEAGPMLAEASEFHPFREGNGRTELQVLKQLPRPAGHRTAWTSRGRTAPPGAGRLAPVRRG